MKATLICILSLFLFGCSPMRLVPGPQSAPDGSKKIVIKKKTDDSKKVVIQPRETPRDVTVKGKGASVISHQVSGSTGVKGGVVVLWPRIIPKSDDADLEKLARLIQGRGKTLVERALPGRVVDVRPAPERVCPQTGCEAASIGFVLAHNKNNSGCIVTAFVSKPGKQSARLIPWVGSVKLKQTDVPFREPPESSLTILDFASCDDLYSALAQGTGEADVEAMPKEVAQ